MEIYKKQHTIKLKYPYEEIVGSFVYYLDNDIIYNNTKHISNIIRNVIYSDHIKYQHIRLLDRICKKYPL